MSDSNSKPEVTQDEGVLIGADSGEPEDDPDPQRGAGHQPRWGERAAKIRKMALRYPELSHHEIAARVGCHPTNVDQVLGRFLGKECFGDVGDFRGVKADALEAVQFRTLASITDDDISKASYLQRVTGVAIIEDKIRLMRGQPTSLHIHALVDVLQAIKQRGDE